MELYVGTYHKYNCRNIDGKWINLDDYTDKENFIAACKEINKDENNPEFMFQDWKGEKWEKSLYSECSVPEEYWEIKEALKNSSIDGEIFNTWLNWSCEKGSVDNVRKAEEQYCGKYDNGKDYAQEYYKECGFLKEDNPLKNFVNWEAVWKNMCSNGMYENNGHIFDNNR